MRLRLDEATVQWNRLDESFNHTVELLVCKISKRLCAVKPSQQLINSKDVFEVILTNPSKLYPCKIPTVITDTLIEQ